MGDRNQNQEVIKLHDLIEKYSYLNKTTLQAELASIPHARLCRILSELLESRNMVAMENASLHEKQRQLEFERAHYVDYYNQVPVGCLTVNGEERIVEANIFAATLLGADQKSLVNLPITEFIHDEDRTIYMRHINEIYDSGGSATQKLRMVKRDKSVFYAHLKVVSSQTNVNPLTNNIIFYDTASSRSVEKERELIALLLTQINTSENLHACMSSLTYHLQDWSGCEAVGIRLQDREDYPYYETRGFASRFVEAENMLCVYGPDGKLALDSSGKPVLECMCGNVLRGRFDPAQPFFSEYGSFWSNNTTELIADSKETDQHTRTINRCNGEGYESVALIPLTVKQDIFGLLQFNDRRPNRFTPETIAHLERIADFLALALSKRQAEKDLFESEAKFRTLAEFAYAMETWQLPDSTYRYISPSCKRVTGYSAEEFLENPGFLTAITHPEDKHKVIEHFHTIHKCNQEQNAGLEFRILTPEGTTRWLSHSCTAVYGKDGIWLGRRGSYRDITKRVEAEQENKKLERKLLQIHKAESLERMAGAIAHHFNNKLHVIQAHLQLAMESLPQHDDSHYNMGAAQEAAVQAAEVSQLMLTYLGQAKGKRKPLDLARICRESLRHLTSNLPRSIVVESYLECPGPTVNSNTKQIRQILSKLLANASEAIGENKGTINVNVGTAAPDAISSLHRFPHNWQPNQESYAFLEVRDNGCGLRASEIEEAFDPFYSTKFTGRGLGLSVVRGLTQAHNGVVTVESSPGAGSTFRVFFPLTEGKAPDMHRGSLKNQVDPKSAGTVLVVDDDEIVLEITCRLFSNLGYKVLRAKDGLEAVEVFKQNKEIIDLVVSDFAMPQLNGLEMSTALRKVVPDIPIILASGYSEEMVLSESHPNGPQFFLEKPYTIKELKKVVARALQTKAEGGNQRD